VLKKSLVLFLFVVVGLDLLLLLDRRRLLSVAGTEQRSCVVRVLLGQPLPHLRHLEQSIAAYARWQRFRRAHCLSRKATIARARVRVV
jgi:hypothetical protein